MKLAGFWNINLFACVKYYQIFCCVAVSQPVNFPACFQNSSHETLFRWAGSPSHYLSIWNFAWWLNAGPRFLFTKGTHTYTHRRKAFLLFHTYACSSVEYILTLFDEWSSGLFCLIGFIWFWGEHCVQKMSKRNIHFGCDLVVGLCVFVFVYVCVVMNCVVTNQMASLHSCRQHGTVSLDQNKTSAGAHNRHTLQKHISAVIIFHYSDRQ